MVEASPNQEKRWLPLESDPQIFTQYAAGLGHPSERWSFHDIYGFEPEMWTAFVP